MLEKSVVANLSPTRRAGQMGSSLAQNAEEGCSLHSARGCGRQTQEPKLPWPQTLLPTDWGCFTDCKTLWFGYKEKVVVSFFLGRSSKNLLLTKQFPVGPAWEKSSWRSGCDCRGILQNVGTDPCASAEPWEKCTKPSMSPVLEAASGLGCSATQTAAENSAASISFSRWHRVPLCCEPSPPEEHSRVV